MQARVACADVKSFVNESSLATAVGETRSRLERVHRREPRRLGHKTNACPQTSTAEALERPGVGPK